MKESQTKKTKFNVLHYFVKDVFQEKIYIPANHPELYLGNIKIHQRLHG